MNNFDKEKYEKYRKNLTKDDKKKSYNYFIESFGPEFIKKYSRETQLECFLLLKHTMINDLNHDKISYSDYKILAKKYFVKRRKRKTLHI